jgi:hypothetical protein
MYVCKRFLINLKIKILKYLFIKVKRSCTLHICVLLRFLHIHDIHTYTYIHVILEVRSISKSGIYKTSVFFLQMLRFVYFHEVHLLEKSSSVFPSFFGNQNEKKYFTLNKWRLTQVAADYSTKGKNIKASNPMFFLYFV